MVRAYIGIGSSIDHEKNIIKALAVLSQKFKEVCVSPVYESEAVGFDGGNFYNLVVSIQTKLDIAPLIACLKNIEKEQGKVNSFHQFPYRNIDLDLLLYGAEIHPELNVPRDEICKNAFVLLPLSELAPEIKHPISGKSFHILWNEYPKESQKLWRLDLTV